MTAAIASPNIALIKYWGNRNDKLRLPMADSVSMTLSEPVVRIAIDHAKTLEIRSSTMREERPVTGKHFERFQTHLAHVKTYFETLGAHNALPASLQIDIDSMIPPAVGLASSAAVFGCLAQAIRQLVAPTIALTDGQTSVIARLGSGSAARSVSGGFVALEAGEGDAIDSSFAKQVANEDHWMLHDFVIIPSHEEKKTGSTEGHSGAHTSPLFPARIEAIRSRRQRECIDAIVQRDFEKLQSVSEEDALDMHAVMHTQSPPLQYLSNETYRIVQELRELRRTEHLPVLYTMDAGPTVHAICTEEAAARVRAFANTQTGCTLFASHTGPGARTA
jgi:diphosphomevalonate decarboxylase